MIVPIFLSLAGLIWAIGFGFVQDWPLEEKKWFLLFPVTALVVRLFALSFPPYEEIDFYRYFWDATQVLAGYNPYAYPISDLIHPHPKELQDLQAANPALISGIRQDTHLLSTIYAPMAIALFALIDTLPGPTELGFFASFIMAEIAALFLLMRWGSIRDVRVGIWALAANPLLIFATYNGLHFDIWLVPLLLGWVLALRQQKVILALLFLSAAIALRHWPLLLLPLSLMAIPTWPRRMRIGFALIPIFALLFLPQILEYGSDHSGLRQYGATWEMNDALFLVLKALFGSETARLLALAAPAALAILIALFARSLDPAVSGLLVVGLLLLLSPTFFPWYWIWMLPFLILVNSPVRIAGLALAAVLPAYYFRFWLEDRGEELLFDQTLVWVEFSPIFILVVLSVIQHVRRSYHSCPQ